MCWHRRRVERLGDAQVFGGLVCVAVANSDENKQTPPCSGTSSSGTSNSSLQRVLCRTARLLEMRGTHAAVCNNHLLKTRLSLLPVSALAGPHQRRRKIYLCSTLRIRMRDRVRVLLSLQAHG